MDKIYSRSWIRDLRGRWIRFSYFLVGECAGVEFEDAQNEVVHSLILYLRSESHPFTIGIYAISKISNFNMFRHFSSAYVLFSSTTCETGVCARGLFTHARRTLGKGKHYAIILL